MSLFDKLSSELRNAGKAAQGAIDEGKVRLEIFRVRQLADKAAQAIGYAVYKAKKDGVDLGVDTQARLIATLNEHEAEATRLEHELAAHRASPPKSDAP
jgi:hypothetical protein